VEIKTVTWSKDSHGLFDYESKNIQSTKTKIEASSKAYKYGTDIMIKGEEELAYEENDFILEQECIFSVQREKNGKFYLKSGYRSNPNNEENIQANSFLIVRSLKNDEGVQKGHGLDLGDVIRLGRIEYRVLEFQDHNAQVYTMLNNKGNTESYPFTISTKDCNNTAQGVRQCKICLMDEHDSPEILVNPCNCKGTSEYVHIKCLQDWISCKVKKKVNPSATCIYWKKLNCEICKVALPDLVEIGKQSLELVPIYRSESPYLLLERVFYDKTKESANNSKTMILLSVSKETESIKLGRGHECDLRENDISVSRLHAFIKYEDGRFIITDNNSKFGTLILLRKDYEIERKKVALQSERTVITFSMKQSSSNGGSKDASASKSRKTNSPKFIENNLALIPPFPSSDKKSSDLNESM